MLIIPIMPKRAIPSVIRCLAVVRPSNSMQLRSMQAMLSRLPSLHPSAKRQAFPARNSSIMGMLRAAVPWAISLLRPCQYRGSTWEPPSWPCTAYAKRESSKTSSIAFVPLKNSIHYSLHDGGLRGVPASGVGAYLPKQIAPQGARPPENKCNDSTISNFPDSPLIKKSIIHNAQFIMQNDFAKPKE